MKQLGLKDILQLIFSLIDYLSLVLIYQLRKEDMSTLQNYKQKWSTFGSQNIHILPWGYVLLKNMFQNGKLGKNPKQNSLLTYLPHPN